MKKTNFHTHTIFCDGEDSPRALAEAASAKGFASLGFSSHAMRPFSDTWHIAPREYGAYVKAVRDAQKEFEGRLEILCGFEADYIPGMTVPRMSDYADLGADFLIGATHYIMSRDGNFTVDEDARGVKAGIDNLFGGSAKEAVCVYFSLQREMLQKGDFAIWAHPDLFRKRNKELRLFDERESWYRGELVATANVAKHSGVVAEINTGGIARGAMDDVYPSADFLKILHDTGVPVTISSDAHRREDLDSAFDKAVGAAVKAGYSELVVLRAGGARESQKIQL